MAGLYVHDRSSASGDAIEPIAGVAIAALEMDLLRASGRKVGLPRGHLEVPEAAKRGLAADELDVEAFAARLLPNDLARWGGELEAVAPTKSCPDFGA